MSSIVQHQPGSILGHHSIIFVVAAKSQADSDELAGGGLGSHDLPSAVGKARMTSSAESFHPMSPPEVAAEAVAASE